MLQTDTDSFTLSLADGPYYRADIPYRFTNRTGAPVYVVNCNGDVSPSLDRYDDDRWSLAWSPEMNGCLSLPIVIESGASYADTLRFAAGIDGNLSFNQIEWSRDSATFRLNWVQALSSFADTLPFGPQIPLEHRVSNPFTLRIP